MPSNWVTAAVMWGIRLASSIPCRTERAMYSGKSTADWLVAKNFSTASLPAPFTLMSNRLSCR